MASLDQPPNEASTPNTTTESKDQDDTKTAAPTTEKQKPEEEFFPLSFFKNHKFESPTKRISHHSNIGKFLTSPTYTKLIKFLNDLSDSVKQQTISSQCHKSSTTLKFLSMLDAFSQYCDEIEPLQIQSRYGNKAYRIWHNKISSQSKSFINKLLPDSWTNNNLKQAIINELDGYLIHSFGDITRIDYGTGHELTFICFVLVLTELRIFRHNDYKSIILLIFNKYLNLMRKIQTKYALEPAGTKGVWGLDDYQFLPFFFGAAQLIENKNNIKPKDILNKDVLNKFASEYLYVSSIQFILKMKTGPFHEHSPLLFDISAVPFWFKVKNGLLKMYQDDVLKKLPVIQHFLFGSVLSIDLPPLDRDNKMNDEQQQILKRKQALIDKLNAKNPKFVKGKLKYNKKQSKQSQSQQNNSNSNNDNDNNDEVVTKAPWAK